MSQTGHNNLTEQQIRLCVENLERLKNQPPMPALSSFRTHERSPKAFVRRSLRAARAAAYQGEPVRMTAVAPYPTNSSSILEVS